MANSDMYAVIFDADGTLVDSQAIIHGAMVRAFEQFDYEPLPIAQSKKIIGLTLDEAIAQLLGRPVDDEIHLMAQAYKDHYLDLLNEPDMQSPLFDGIAEAMEHLAERDDCLLAIATGKSRRGLDRLIESHGFGKAIVTSRTADECPSKPHPAMVLECCADLGVETSQAVMVGDTSFDMLMAKSAGANALGVNWGYHEEAEIRDAGADTIIDHPNLIVDAVDELLELETCATT